MKLLNLVIFCLVFSQSFCQTTDEEIIQLFTETKSVSEINSSKFAKQIQFSLDERNSDSVEFGVNAYHFHFNPVAGKDSYGDGDSVYYGSMYAFNDSIIFCSLIKIKEVIINDNLQSKFDYEYTSLDSSKLNSFLVSHNRKYSANWTIPTFVEYKTEYGAFGTACTSFSSELTRGMKSVVAFVLQKDETNLLKLASSFIAVERAYGVTGLYFLDRREYKLSSAAKKLIAINQNSDQIILTCFGCVWGTPKSLSDALSDVELEKMYQFVNSMNNFSVGSK